MPNLRSTRDFIATALPLLWIGLVLGVSFLATPAKFRAENLDGAVALSISLVTFLWLHIAEAVFAVVLAVLLVLLKARWLQWALFAVAVLALALQADWILPAFEARTGFIPLLPVLDYGQLHTAFATTEGIKILALLALAFIVFRGPDTVREAAAVETPVATT
jgi:hypothetical protein